MCRAKRLSIINSLCGCPYSCRLFNMQCLYTVLYCHLWPVWLDHIFLRYLTIGKIFGKIVEYKMCVLILSTTFMQNVSHIKKNSGRYYHKCTKVFMYSTHSCPILMKIEFFRQIFEKLSNI
jgi:hypothetical protein